MAIKIDQAKIKDSLRLACGWITDRAMNHAETVGDEVNEWKYDFKSWKGCVQEYDGRANHWWAFGPVWHTGQAVKALVLAYQALGDKQLLDFAREGAAFLLQARLNDPKDPDFGALLSYEADEGAGALLANTSGMLEALDGLMFIGDQTNDKIYWDAAIACLAWVERRMFLPQEGLFYDRFSLKDRSTGPMKHILIRGFPGRPLLDDGVFLKGYQKTGRESFRDVFFKTANRLLKEEMPLGNWIRFPPANIDKGTIHPRHAFWWGRPFVMGWKEAKKAGQHVWPDVYLDCARRSAQWYLNAQRKDGGFFRGTYLDFKTDTFGQATSGILAACSLWRDLIVEGQGDEYREPFKLALSFAQSMQFGKTTDPNLEGAILEKVYPPDGTDKSPYNCRDLASIFYAQTVSMALLDGLL